MDSNELEKIKNITNTYQATSLFSSWQSARELGYTVALWQLPFQKEKQLVVNFSKDIARKKIVLEDLEPGFAFSPFLNMEGHDTLFIEADLYYSFGEKGEILTEKKSDSLPLFQKEKWEKHCQSIGSVVADKNHAIDFPQQNETNTSKEHYLNSVRAAIASIKSGHLKKVVISRTKEVVDLPSNLSLLTIFERLCKKYPTAFVSMVYLPQLDQVWLGATPEILVAMNKEGIFRTVALAGTQSIFDKEGQTIAAKQALWSQKEIEEQALVGRYIISCFKKIRVREYLEEGPKSVMAGNLIHLMSDYVVDTKAINFPEIGTVMLELLHPTSAVCGMPKMEALQFIQTHEGYNREFYSGFLGPVNIEQETHLFVNLRCMKIEQGKATIYAGGGITEDSVPEKEWQETELKTQTMLAVLQ